MQLSKIKIAGFKSFVDPTTIMVPSHCVAIVGPNGCGKSNIIDAVSWVMGESSPKYLRGESLTDVIFNGSSARKPVGQASVELIFDNHDGAIGGEYAKYTEISIKRIINRDADSTYFLNNTRCRKKDIKSVFHGTGLGPRSYSIIGQNMISRIIEAKPEELRTYLEEAAGISKYKERRHETELRMQHTKENLDRVKDVLAELEKQLNHLKHQATVAEKFKNLKQQERVTRAELFAIQWKQLDSRLVDCSLKIQYEETTLEGRQSELTSTERDLEQLRHEQRVSQDAFQEVQRRYYAIGNEITRIEQDVLHHQEREKQWQHDLQQSETDCEFSQKQLEESDQQIINIEKEIQTLLPKLEKIKNNITNEQAVLFEKEEALQVWQEEWDHFNTQNASISQTAQVKKNHIQQVEQRIALLEKRKNQLQQEQIEVDFEEMSQDIVTQEEKARALEQQITIEQNQLHELRDKIYHFNDEQKEAHTELDQIRSVLQRLKGQQASLEALQQTALGQRDNPALPWIAEHHLETQPRLAQHLQVEPGWELAIEKVLGFCLQAICLDQPEKFINNISNFNAGNICLLKSTHAVPNKAQENKGNLLSNKLQSPYDISSLLAGIYTAENLDEALLLCKTIAAHESIITKDGIWMNQSWLKILRQEDPAAGLFHREQELKKLAAEIAVLEEKQTTLQLTISQIEQDLKATESQREALQPILNQYQAEFAQINMQQQIKKERLEELKKQAARSHQELTDHISQLELAQDELKTVRKDWEEALADLEEQTITRENLIKNRDTARHTLQNQRHQVDELKDELHDLELRLQKSHSQKSALKQQSERLQTHLGTLNERKISLQSDLSSMPPLDTFKKSLSRALDKHVNVESELNTTKAAMETLNQEFKNLEDKKQIIEREINKLRTSLESLRVELQGWKVKSETILEQLKETEFNLEDVLKQLPAESTAEDWQHKLEQLIQRINRLGPINLIAIEEYTTCLERKNYLDSQVADLMGGLATLEEAIEKIDRETRARFKETFEKVNTQFQELFPTVFGGGKAYLELTSDNLLEAGVTVMACPPGKRNSSIYLLSGGEKSLTAIALIFSIFHLNPAPFCLLDEVDAALDDANVLRFTRLVKTMMEKTQFIFISHNKMTIEMGEHLIGVTMNEPGVSRLVSVDIEKAISMVASE